MRELAELGGRLLLPFRDEVLLYTQAGRRSAVVRGELELGLALSGFNRINVELARLGVVSKGTVAGPEGEDSGRLGIRGLPAEAEIEAGALGGPWFLNLNVKAVLHHETMVKQSGFRFIEPDRFVAPMASFRGLLEGSLEKVRAEEFTFSGNLRLDSEEADIGWVRRLEVRFSRSELMTLNPAALGVSPRAAGFRHQLKVRLIRLLDGDDDPEPTGDAFGSQLAAAIEIWNKCCIEIDEQREGAIVDGELKHSDDPRVVCSTITDSDEDTIEVIFVTDQLRRFGGGAACSCGLNTAKVVLTEEVRSNPNLLAHELGHVLSGVHPAQPDGGVFWQGDRATVLEPSTPEEPENPSRNTFANCRRADNPALISQVACRFQADQ